MFRHRQFAIIIAVVISMGASGPVFAESAGGSVNSGNALYGEGEFEEALKKYEAAQVESPADGRIMFNLGNAQYMLGNHEDALSEYRSATLSGRDEMRARSLYNSGNALFRAGRLEEAVEQYLQAVELEPEDEDAKYNLEFVRREIRRRMEEEKKRQEEQEKQKQEDQEQDGDGEPEPGGDESDDQEGKGDQQEQSEQNQEEDKSGQGQGDQKEQQDQPEPSPQPDPKESPEQGAPEEAKGQSPSQDGGMSDENMQRWLDAVENETAENIKDFLKKQQPVNVTPFPEDW
jgi:Ca-activated chloride channel family protein